MSPEYLKKSLAWIILVLVAFAVSIAVHGGIDPVDALLIFALCFACELVDSGLGMGYGTILTPTLLLLGYDAHDIVPTVLMSELLSGLTASFFHNEIRNVQLGFRGRDFLPAAILAAGSVAGVSVGVALALNLPKDSLNLGVGIIILASGFFVLLHSRRHIEYRRWKMVLLAAVASFNKAVSGGGYGPLVTSGQILSGVSGKASIGITSFAEAFTCLLAVTLFLAQGEQLNLILFVPMCAGALLSVPFSVFAISVVREDLLRTIIGVVTMLMGALTLIKLAT
ncbi:sulfite exporter TauE/SafE family protein [Dokdonella sp.]|uniref:sulfite exporter TauE/SafE family protein n=1 Tax=Dokdonella sp. TaxID=2291710 RepID=UPI0035282235